ncbi:MAG: glycerol-3-phosphate dehydrogenase/oxidase [Planctomycetia bacterium]|nr:glycerol-3-phosphate dehydrogenase/oxidase [Planctomycetia bacterium]
MTPRETSLERVRSGGPWDFVVVGGGATGLGTALDAVTRGFRTLLLERDDFAKGTSSRSTKLIHGGVRYLAQGRVGLVREALHERERLLSNAPHLVHDRAFLVPAYSWWERPYYATGLWLYDRLAGNLARGRSRGVGRVEALRLAPTLEPVGLQGGVVYQDGQFDDARLAITLARTIDDHGGTALNWMNVDGLVKDAAGRVAGLHAVDAETGERLTVGAKAVVNATGVFADEVRRIDEPGARPMITPSRGAHLVLDRRFLPGETAVLVPKTDDGRVLFAIPWHDRVVVGTTDTPAGATAVEPEASRDELDFLLTHAGRYLATDPTPDDVRSVFAGLRPLIAAGQKRTASLSREHAAVVSTSGLVTVTGGKWTTYRRMAENAVDLASEVAGVPRRPCVTADLRLHGWVGKPTDGPYSAYGSDAEGIRLLAAERPELEEILVPGLPVRGVDVVWAARREAARTVEDVLARRTRALLLDARASMEAAPRVAARLAEELGRGERWRAGQVESFRAVAAGYVFPE